MKQVVTVDYTNWRGLRRVRRITPIRLVWENNEWHPETQWILYAQDDDGACKAFAMKNIHSWASGDGQSSVKGKDD